MQETERKNRSPVRPPAAGPDRRPANRASALSRKDTFLTTFYEPVRGSIKEDARTGHRIYRLKGYTTIDKINRKFQQERNQRNLRHILTFLMILILLVILFVIYNPFTNLDELKKITGEDSLYQRQKGSSTSQSLIDFP